MKFISANLYRSFSLKKIRLKNCKNSTTCVQSKFYLLCEIEYKNFQPTFLQLEISQITCAACYCGRVAEWFKAAVLKTAEHASVP